MKIRADQLPQHLNNGLAPIYIISGDEPLLVQEAKDSIYQCAKQQDYLQREKLTADNKFDWQYLLSMGQALSLFQEKKCVELTIPNGKPGQAGGKVLSQYAETPALDHILIIITPKLDQATQKTKWFKTIEQKAVFIPIWPLDNKQLPNWLAKRLQQLGLQAEPPGLQLLAQKVEGNLLAAQQEIEKLSLLYGQGKISDEQMSFAIADNARFNIFDLADSAVSGDLTRSLRVLEGLRQEAVEPILILWALAREARTLALIFFDLSQGKQLHQCWQQYRVWQNKQAIMQHAIRRLDIHQCHQLLQQAAKIDKVLKGIEQGDSWDLLQQLCMAFQGNKQSTQGRPHEFAA